MIQASTKQSEVALGLRHKYFLCGEPSAPLVLLVHGRAGTYDVMWAFRRCLPERSNIFAVQAPEPDELGGYSWWNVETQGATVEAATPGLQTLIQFCAGLENFYNLHPHKRAALGFSQGAGILSILIQTRPRLFDAVALLAGFVLEAPASPDVISLPEVLVLHGSQDDIVPVLRARQGKSLLESKGYSVQIHEDPVGHKVGAPGMRILRDWLAQALV